MVKGFDGATPTPNLGGGFVGGHNEPRLMGVARAIDPCQVVHILFLAFFGVKCGGF